MRARCCLATAAAIALTSGLALAAPDGDPVADDEVRALLADVEVINRRYPPVEGYVWLTARIGDVLRRWLDRDVVPAELRALEYEVQTSGRVRLERDGRDDDAPTRARVLDLLRRIQGVTNRSQIATDRTHAVGHVPRGGSLQDDPRGAESRAVTTVTTDATRILVGHNVRRARLDAELSQPQLATRVGVSRNRVADWEAGRHQPNVDHLAAIVAATGAPTVGWFFDEHPDR